MSINQPVDKPHSAGCMPLPTLAQLRQEFRGLLGNGSDVRLTRRGSVLKVSFHGYDGPSVAAVLSTYGLTSDVDAYTVEHDRRHLCEFAIPD